MAPPFRLHPFGNWSLNGVNELGCNSVILYKDDIWKFKYFGYSGTEHYYHMFYVKLNDDISESTETKWFTQDEVRATSRVQLLYK
jgi:hypothetical protein